MPRDKDGKEIKEGDIILLRCRATRVTESEAQCNVTAEPIDGPPSEHRPSLTLNTRLFTREESR